MSSEPLSSKYPAPTPEPSAPQTPSDPLVSSGSGRPADSRSGASADPVDSAASVDAASVDNVASDDNTASVDNVADGPGEFGAAGDRAWGPSPVTIVWGVLLVVGALLAAVSAFLDLQIDPVLVGALVVAGCGLFLVLVAALGARRRPAAERTVPTQR